MEENHYGDYRYFNGFCIQTKKKQDIEGGFPQPIMYCLGKGGEFN